MITELAAASEQGSAAATSPARGTVVVVGSGAAGLALAEALADAGRPVLLLESGGLEPADQDDRNEGTSTGLSWGGLSEGRARTLGGTTALWHGQCTRLHDIDVRPRSWVEHSGWPADLTDAGDGDLAEHGFLAEPGFLAEHYARAESWLGVSGRGYGASRWQEHPDLPPIAWTPDHLEHDFTEYVHRPHLGRTHRDRLVRDPRIRVLLDATVTRVEVTDAPGGGERVSGVQVADTDGRRVTLAADTVVLCAGALENARILQLSDPAGVGLGHGREQTGRFLQDHPIIRLGRVRPVDFRVLQERYVALHRGRRRLFPKVRLAGTAQQRLGLLDATAVFVHDHDRPALAAARRVVQAARSGRPGSADWRDVLAAGRAPAPVLRDAYRRYVRGRSTGTPPDAVWLQLWLEQAPDPESRIRLSARTDRLGLRRAEVHWRAGALELETSRRLAGFVAEDLERLALARVEWLPAMHDDDAWRESVTDAAHPAGTTRMSDRPAEGVVDTDLQVHGVDDLFVVGGSVFPTSGYANPTLTIVALALRLADHLQKTYGPVTP